jgi:hypothetical protein
MDARLPASTCVSNSDEPLSLGHQQLLPGLSGLLQLCRTGLRHGSHLTKTLHAFLARGTRIAARTLRPQRGRCQRTQLLLQARHLLLDPATMTPLNNTAGARIGSRFRSCVHSARASPPLLGRVQQDISKP